MAYAAYILTADSLRRGTAIRHSDAVYQTREAAERAVFELWCKSEAFVVERPLGEAMPDELPFGATDA